MFDAPFPQVLLDLYRVLTGLSFGVNLVSPQCAGVKTTFYTKYVMMISSVALIFVGLMRAPLTHAIRKRRSLRKVMISHHMTAEGALASRDLFVIVLLMHPSVSGTSMQFFLCRTIGEETYMQADYAQHCYDAKWFAFLPLVSFVRRSVWALP